MFLSKTKIILISLSLCLAILSLGSSKVLAADIACPKSQAHPTGSDKSDAQNCKPIMTSATCPSGQVDPKDKTQCLGFGSGCAKSPTAKDCLKQNPIVKDLNTIVNILGTAVALVVVGMIIVGGIQYSIAGDNAQAVTAAKKRITDALIALLAFVFTFAFLQWLIPGGVFS